MNVLFLSAEATPLAKVGGLADVVGALPASMVKLGVDVRIIMPKYESLPLLPNTKLVSRDTAVRIGSGIERVSLYQSSLPGSGVIVYLVEHDGFLSTGPIYDQHGDNPMLDLKRFLFFSVAALAVIPSLDWKPDILHCHDWHTALIPALCAMSGASVQAKSVLTIHNLAHQGAWDAKEVLSFLGLTEQSSEYFAKRDQHADFNLLQQGILAASAVNTVSPAYAREILTSEYGEHLEDTLKEKRPPITGILNGIDVEFFDPAHDRNIRVPYSQAAPAGKLENKLALHEMCGFKPDSRIPTFAFIGRLTGQKGVDLIVSEKSVILDSGARLIILGSGSVELETTLADLAKKYPDQVYCKLGFDSAFAQQIYAGTDLLLMPSRFEPCGLGQMIAMRYGTVAVVRATGGLKDTVPDVSRDRKHGLGFSFQNFDGPSYRDAVTRAITVYHDKDAWSVLIARCLAQDFSWQRSARDYLKLYESLLRLS